LIALYAAASVLCGEAFARARYVFLFIGDGMGAAQRNAAELYLAGMREALGDDSARESQLVMNSFPSNGMIRTDSLSGVTDSAAAGTALATGRKTVNGAVAMNPSSGEKFRSVARAAKDRGMKVGIVTSAFLQDATPAAFFGHSRRRTEYRSLGIQLSESGFDYFAGGWLPDSRAGGKDGTNPLAAAALGGYEVTRTAGEFRALTPGSGKVRVLSIHPKTSGGYMPWAIDGDDAGVSLADFVDKGICLLDGEGGFFMMVEGGKIDIACHANDAAAAVGEVMAFDRAVGRAVAFYRSRPGETLIVVTSDHETGGMTHDASGGAPLFYRALSTQKGSYSAFERTVSPNGYAKFGGALARARAFFGPGVGDTKETRAAHALSMTPKDLRGAKGDEYKKLYATYDPFTAACLREFNASVGITWTTFYHTGKDIPVSAIGAGAERFSGEYENTEICRKIMEAMSD
jgi:alkaline phosphatase